MINYNNLIKLRSLNSFVLKAKADNNCGWCENNQYETTFWFYWELGDKRDLWFTKWTIVF